MFLKLHPAPGARGLNVPSWIPKIIFPCQKEVRPPPTQGTALTATLNSPFPDIHSANPSFPFLFLLMGSMITSWCLDSLEVTTSPPQSVDKDTAARKRNQPTRSPAEAASKHPPISNTHLLPPRASPPPEISLSGKSVRDNTILTLGAAHQLTCHRLRGKT